MVGGWLVGFEASLEGTTPFSNLGISIKIQKGWATTPQHEIIQCVFEGHRNYSSQVSSWWSPPLFLGPLGWNHPPVAALRHCKNRFTYVFHPGGSFRTAWNLSMALCVLYDPWLGAATVATPRPTWGLYKWPKLKSYNWGYFTTISGVISPPYL